MSTKPVTVLPNWCRDMLDSEDSSHNACKRSHCSLFSNRAIDITSFEESGKRMSSTSTDSGRPHSLASLEERERVDDLSILTPREKGCYMVALSQELTNAISLSRKARGVSKAADGKKNSDVHEKCTDHSTQQAALKAVGRGHSMDSEFLEALHCICDGIEKFVIERQSHTF